MNQDEEIKAYQNKLRETLEIHSNFLEGVCAAIGYTAPIDLEYGPVYNLPEIIEKIEGYRNFYDAVQGLEKV
jgi:hypothetical protein